MFQSPDVLDVIVVLKLTFWLFYEDLALLPHGCEVGHGLRDSLSDFGLCDVQLVFLVLRVLLSNRFQLLTRGRLLLSRIRPLFSSGNQNLHAWTLVDSKPVFHAGIDLTMHLPEIFLRLQGSIILGRVDGALALSVPWDMLRISPLFRVADSLELLPVERVDFVQLCVCLEIFEFLPVNVFGQILRVVLPLVLTGRCQVLHALVLRFVIFNSCPLF